MSPEPAAGTGEPGSQWLMNQILTDPAAIRRALRERHAPGAGSDGILAARRTLEVALRNVTGWPRDQDYAGLADAFTAHGNLDAARLLREVAAAGPLMEEATAGWLLRYADRTAIPQQDAAAWLARRGHIDFDPDGPYRGIDGALYRPGVTTRGLAESPVLLVTTRAMSEVITGWRDYEQMRRWLASRGSTGTADLHWPPAAERSRLAREERVLAHLLGGYRNAARVAALIPPVTFTADLRYDLYAALLAAADHDPLHPGSRFRQELGHRLARIPDTALASSGTALDTAGRYLVRLAATPVSCASAMEAVASLRDDDRHAVRARAYRAAASEPARQPAPAPAPLPPGPLPGSDHGPAHPRM